MKVSLSTILGLLLMGGALALHFLKSEKSKSETPLPSKSERQQLSSSPQQFARSYSRGELSLLRTKIDAERPEENFRIAEELVFASKEKPLEKRRQDLMEALSILYTLSTVAPDWEQELVKMRSEQTVIAILDLQGNF